MQFGLAFSFVGQFVALGWMLEIAKRVINNDPNPLPGWDNFSELLVKGLKAWVVGIVYAIPILVILLPIIVASFLMTGSGSFNQSDQTTMIILSILGFCVGTLAFIYSIFIAIASPASYGKLAVTDSIGEALKFGEIFGMIRRSFSPYLMVLVGALCVGFIAPLGLILCAVGVLLTLIYGQAIMGHLIGQAYVQSTTSIPTA
jgi:hypothetical protein